MGSTAPQENAPATILIVEDFNDTREMIKLQLEQAGYKVLDAADGNDAVEVAQQQCPDLILMDLSLPGLDGLSAVCRIREMELLCESPIVAISAHSRELHLEAALAAGCDEYLTKPISADHLKEVVSRLISERRRYEKPAIDSVQMDADQLANALDHMLPKAQ